MSHRRNFLKTTGLATMATAVMGSEISPFQIYAPRTVPSDTLRFGTIGIKGMGWANTKAAIAVPNAQLVALCDIDQSVLDQRMSELAALQVDASKVQTFKDYRKMLEMKDLDFVIIGTPDHWHPLMTIDACKAGKDVYCEKPIANSIGEVLLMEKAQKKYNRAIQVGQWQRSQKHFRDAIDYVHSGKLGQVRMVKTWAFQGWMKPAPRGPVLPVPSGVDYDMWQGPAKRRPFKPEHFHFNFRWFWDYAGGLMCDWGVHIVDYALFGMKATMPKTVSALGGRFAYPDLSHETPDTQSTIYEFNDFILSWEHALAIDNGPYMRTHGIGFIGNNGTLVVDRNGWEVLEEKGVSTKVLEPYHAREDNGVQKHMENFAQVVRNRNFGELNCPIETAALVAKVCQMGNIAYRSGKKLNWDAGKQMFTDTAVNAKYLMAPYYNGYKLTV
jgi:predicted dehydrogenase